MNDLDLIRHFRDAVPGPPTERTAAARSRLTAEVRAATDANRIPSTGLSRRGDRAGGPRRGLALRLALPSAGILVAAGAIALATSGVGGSGTSSADAAIIHHASAAFAARPDNIFHSELQGEGFVVETWQLTSAPYSFLVGKGPSGSVSYSAEDGTTLAHYDPTTNTIYQSPSPEKTPIGEQPSAIDPLSGVKQDLQDGQARVLGAATVDGTATYEIQLADTNGFDAQSLIIYVDQSSYRPVEIADPQSNGTVVHLGVVAFEYLPATPANQNLLSLTARYPSAAVVNEATAAPATNAK